MLATLGSLARHGRAVLILGLAAGVSLPGLAFAMRPWLGEMVAALLFLAALRVGPRQAVGAFGDFGRAVGYALFLQTAFPVAAIGLFLAAGWTGALATGLVLMLAASPISGSPNLAILTGNDPALALRQLVVGTALLPLTVVPVFWLTPAFGDPSAVFAAALRLIATIGIAAGTGFAIRGLLLKTPSAEALGAVDGASALAMAVLVVGLMSAVGPAIRSDPEALAVNLAAAFAASFGLQIVVGSWFRWKGMPRDAGPLAIVAGNRNIALFLTALPSAVTDPLLLFIGCYQVPMYLTPMLLGRFHRTGRMV